jgi:hypothetical protein
LNVGLKARAEAYHEVAEHLTTRWTDDPVEEEQGKIVEAELREKADKFWAKAEGRA